MKVTPGQTAFDNWILVIAHPGMNPHWDKLSDFEREGWEAIAKAVLDEHACSCGSRFCPNCAPEYFAKQD